ncbi:MAG TPA: T9SS type A sorting domain-containing protein, partial [Bacteroidaceae bacterium]|nr:T9SS type A sorting domain-containing protein [Bacteroidaceae bacterium]
GEDGSRDLFISGATLKATVDSIDFSLLELSEIPPDSYNAYYAGWDLTEHPPPGVTTIHHPMGDVKKVSGDFDQVSTPQSTADIIGGGELLDYYYFSFWWVHQWDFGSTEGGSSGGPLFNNDRRVIGVLSGGQAKCGDSVKYDPETDRIIFNKNVNVNDYFTRLSVAWDYYPEDNKQLKRWLDPINTGLRTIGGYNPVTNDIGPVISHEHFNLYPNPASDRIYLAGRGDHEPILNYTIYDLTGKIVLAGNILSENLAEINLSGLQRGIYILNVRSRMKSESFRFMIE